ncbi:4Fe-4S binding protein [Mariniplasma anaerobium]|uniref:2-oxoacid:acceptor oxidoreductase subunit delta n=1 Tax=Mariniplasma anaerobium TaxID=2735436 RepID=A0A7U9TLS8_9MOLU|nr:4Fe-4S binding protein [Mariniplasma anaerobium]BCR36471.1 2-oxoacid:acceptor oxidoreductase subunit delta [Mariniplasma anaerobium]
MKKGILTFNDKDCKGCELCTSACPVDILYLDKNRMNEKGYHLISVTDMDKCIGCANCAIICPDSVIKVEVNDR